MQKVTLGEELIKVEKKRAEDLKNVCGKQGGTAPSPEMRRDSEPGCGLSCLGMKNSDSPVERGSWDPRSLVNILVENI